MFLKYVGLAVNCALSYRPECPPQFSLLCRKARSNIQFAKFKLSPLSNIPTHKKHWRDAVSEFVNQWRLSYHLSLTSKYSNLLSRINCKQICIKRHFIIKWIRIFTLHFSKMSTWKVAFIQLESIVGSNDYSELNGAVIQKHLCHFLNASVSVIIFAKY